MRVARIHDPAYLGEEGVVDKSALHIDLVISPEEEVASAVAALARVPGATDVLEFAGGKVLAVGAAVDARSPLIGKPLADLKRRTGEPLLIAGVYHEETVSAPSRDIRVEEGDVLFLVSGRPAVRRALTGLGKRWARTRNVLIAGGGREGVAIARRLSAAGVHTKIIDHDAAVCDRISQAARRHPRPPWRRHGRTPVGRRRGSPRGHRDRRPRRRERQPLHRVTGAASRSQTCRRARRLAGADAVRVHDRGGHRVEPAGDVPKLPPILQLVRRSDIVAVRTLRESLVEGIEFVAREGAGIVGLPLALLHMPHGSLVGALVRDDEVIIPDGSTVVQVGDRVVLFARPVLIPRMQRLLAPG